MDDAAIDGAARELLSLLASDRFGSRLPLSRRPRVPLDGWRVQRRVSELRSSPVLGWKCGLPREDRWVVAAMHETLPSGAQVRVPFGADGSAAAGIEPEWAFVLRCDLPPRAAPYAPAEIDAAIGDVRLAIEVLGCRYVHPAQASGPELMADGLWHRSLVMGPTVQGPQLGPLALTIDIEGQCPIQVAARHPDGDARRPLHWLAEFLRQQGVGLAAGQAVITGSLSGVIVLPQGRPATLRYGDLGAVSLTLVPC